MSLRANARGSQARQENLLFWAPFETPGSLPKDARSAFTQLWNPEL